MSIVLKGLCRFLIKFCWIIAIVAIAFGAVGFLTKTESKSTVTKEYTSTVKLMVDMKHLESAVNMDESKEGSNSKEFFTGYNTAYSLFPTYKDVLLAKSTVLERIKDEYFKITNEEITVSYLSGIYTVSFPENSLSFNISCKTDSSQKSETLIDLMCKYGVSRINELSDIIKVEVSSVSVTTSLVELKGEQETINAYKEKISSSALDIYFDAADALENDYVQKEEIQSGFSFAEIEGGIILSFESSSLAVNNFVTDYVTGADFVEEIEGLEIVKVNDAEIKYIEDKYSSVTSNTVTTPGSNNTLILAVLGAFAAGIVLCFIYLVRCDELKKNLNKQTAQEDSAQNNLEK